MVKIIYRRLLVRVIENSCVKVKVHNVTLWSQKTIRKLSLFEYSKLTVFIVWIADSTQPFFSGPALDNVFLFKVNSKIWLEIRHNKIRLSRDGARTDKIFFDYFFVLRFTVQDSCIQDCSQINPVQTWRS